eukprot:GFYU01002385.1.p1 GENE.GFYU01002385.1~~GFYU01002385.1.p1  ORF type:complete len:161 (+),score=58.64 GFYU01002385.1:36-518(+)
MVVKTETCSFSGFRIYPGHGSRFVRSDSKTFIFCNQKISRSFHMKRNPRKLNWTILYRRHNKKGSIETHAKKRVRKAAKMQRAIVGASIDVIKAKRNMKPEQRAAAREAALREVKERNKAKQAAKKASKAPAKAAAKAPAKAAPTKAAPAKSAPKKGGKR